MSVVEQLRESYRPHDIRVVFVGESPPASSGKFQFFFSPTLSHHDNLFRGIMAALYCADGDALKQKPQKEWLSRFCREGYWLLDLAKVPVNKLPASEKQRVLKASVPALVDTLRLVAPSVGVILCSVKVYKLAYPALTGAGIRVLHDDPIPFPLPQWRDAFVKRVRAALKSTPCSGESSGERRR